LLGDKPLPQQMQQIKAMMHEMQCDVFFTPLEDRQKKLLLADMDATIVVGETLDDLAAEAGLGSEIAAITARAMAGELDFQDSLNERVKKLGGLPLCALEKTRARMELSKGADTAIKFLRAKGCASILVSGGFTYFTSAVAALCDFAGNHGNVLEIENSALTGRVLPPILDKDAKRQYLLEYTEKLGLTLSQTMAVGDGANDLPMLQLAGMGVGYKPKAIVAASIENCIVHSDLLSLIFIQGHTWQEVEKTLNYPETTPTLH
jgi:phosphoserine phosphatase